MYNNYVSYFCDTWHFGTAVGESLTTNYSVEHAFNHIMQAKTGALN